MCKKMGDFFWKIRKIWTATLFQRSQVVWKQAQPALDAGGKEASTTPALSTSRAGRRFYPPNLADEKETADANVAKSLLGGGRSSRFNGRTLRG